MYLLRVSQKFLFICNLCWIMGIIFRMISLAHWPDLVVKSILVMGMAVALPLGIALNALILVLWMAGKIRIPQLPGALLVCNLLFIPVIILFRFF